MNISNDIGNKLQLKLKTVKLEPITKYNIKGKKTCCILCGNREDVLKYTVREVGHCYKMNAKINTSCFVMQTRNSKYVWKRVTKTISGNGRTSVTLSGSSV